MMRGILVIYTGGTIGMVQGAQGLEPGAGVLEAALQVLAPGRDLTVECFDPLIDSSNIHPRDWNRMLDRIEAWPGDVIIVHGTDTMAFTGAALSAALPQSAQRVILCGSMQPLGFGGDAEGNLALALQAAETAAAGVWLAFAGKLLPGAGLVKHHSQQEDAFRAQPQAGFAAKANRFADKRLAILSLSPGLPAAAVAAALAALDGAVLRVFGAGTIMNDPALIATLRAAIATGCRIRAVSQCEAGGLEDGAYAAGAALWAAGVENGGPETGELALARLWLSL